jgi:ketopantoate reductase
MRIAVVGAGGVGGYFGGRLAEAGADVVFLARGAHLDAMRANGLRIDSPIGNAHIPRINATHDPAAIGPVDIVLFAVKLYDTDAASRLLPDARRARHGRHSSAEWRRRRGHRHARGRSRRTRRAEHATSPP